MLTVEQINNKLTRLQHWVEYAKLIGHPMPPETILETLDIIRDQIINEQP